MLFCIIRQSSHYAYRAYLHALIVPRDNPLTDNRHNATQPPVLFSAPIEVHRSRNPLRARTLTAEVDPDKCGSLACNYNHDIELDLASWLQS